VRRGQKVVQLPVKPEPGAPHAFTITPQLLQEKGVRIDYDGNKDCRT
jgi:hypothetical protein